MVVPYHFALWLVLPTLSIHDDLKTILWAHEMVGWEILGAALDELLPLHEGDAAVTPSVLRLSLRKIGDDIRATAANLVVSSADMYEVYTGAIPTPAHFGGWVDFMFELSYGMLADGEGRLSVAAVLEVATAPRYVPDTAHKDHGCYMKMGRIITRNLPGSVDRGFIYDNLDPDEMALEVGVLLTRVLPPHDYVAEYHGTAVSALAAIRDALAAAEAGGVGLVTQTNVRQVVPHHPVLTLVVGTSMGASAAMAMVTEILRIGLGTTASLTFALDSVPTAVQALEFLLPQLRADDVSGLPPSQRLLFLTREVQAARRSEASASTAAAAGGRTSADDGTPASGALGYPLVYQQQLRTLIGSASFVDCCDLIESYLGASKYDTALSAIFASGHLPLMHALGGQLRSLPSVPLVDKIVRILVPLGGQWVANTMAAALLPVGVSGLKRRMAVPRPDIFKLLVRGAVDTVPWEDACFEIIAHAAYKKPEGKIPVAQRFANLERLRMVKYGISAMLEAYGKLSDHPRSFVNLVARCELYDQHAAAAGTPEAMRISLISSVLTGAFAECATSDTLILSSKNPLDELPTAMVVAGSGAEASLEQAKAVLPQQAEMVTSLYGALTPNQAKVFGHDGVLRVPGLVRPMVDFAAEKAEVAASDARDSAKRQLEAEQKRAAKAEVAAVAGAADGEAAKDDAPPVACAHRRLCRETATRIEMGDPAGDGRVESASKAELLALKTKYKRLDACDWVLLSRSRYPGVCCGTPDHPKHLRHNSPAHKISPAFRKAALALLTVAALPGAAPCGVAKVGPVGRARLPQVELRGPSTAAVHVAPMGMASAAVEGAAPYRIAGVAPEVLFAPPTRSTQFDATVTAVDSVVEIVSPAAVAERTVAADAATVGLVPRLAAALFERLGGHVFVPVRFTQPFSPEIGLPTDGAGLWFGEPDLGPATQTRESVLAVACRWAERLFPGLAGVVPFGQFEDVLHAGGQVTGAVLPPTDVALTSRSGCAALRWVPMAALVDTSLHFVASMVVARLESFARPAPLLSPRVARVGAMDPVAANVPSTLEETLGACVPMTSDEVVREATTATADLRTALAARIEELRSETGARAEYLVSELTGWLGAIRLPTFGDIEPSVMAQAARLTDPRLARLPLPSDVRPVTTPALPPLPAFDPSAQAGIPAGATNWSHALSPEAHRSCVAFFQKFRKACLHYLRTEDGGKAWGLLPKSLAIGVDHFQPWLAALAIRGESVVLENGAFRVVDCSKAPATSLNRTYIGELFEESGCVDLALRDAALTHGFPYLTPSSRRPPMIVLQRPLQSLFTSRKAFLSLHAETLRLSGKGPEENPWFTLQPLEGLDDGVLCLPSCPCSFDPTGCVPRDKEERSRPIKDCSAPHTLLLTMCPPTPPLHDLGPGKREAVTSINAATGVFESKAARRAAKMRQRGGKLPAPHQRHTPGERRAPAEFGMVDTLEVGPLELLRTGNSTPVAPRRSLGWLQEQWAYPQELKPFFIDVMLAVCVLGYGAELCGLPLIAIEDDIADMFFTFPLMALQCRDMNLLRLDPRHLSDESLDAALMVVQAKCMEMGVSPSSNWAQRFATQCNAGFIKRFHKANEVLMCALEESCELFGAWRSGRREVGRATGRPEDGGAYNTTYTDDALGLVIGIASAILYLEMHVEHYGPRGLNMQMAIAAKRHLGVGLPFIGGNLMTTGALAYVAPPKVLKTDQSLQAAIAGTMVLGDWTKLIGLLNHLVCLMLMPVTSMYEVYTISDASRQARVGLDEPIVRTPRGVAALQAWLIQVRTVAGTTALSAALQLRRAAHSGVVHMLRSDAAILGTHFPGICCALYQRVLVLPLTTAWLEMPIVVLEFLGGLINLLVFGTMLAGVPCALILDALVVPTVMGGKARAPMMRWLQLRFVELVQRFQLNVTVTMEYGTFNSVCDAGSRGKIDEMEAIMGNLHLTPEYIEPDAEVVALMDRSLAEWRRLSAADRAASQRESVEVVTRRQQRRAAPDAWAPAAALTRPRPPPQFGPQPGPQTPSLPRPQTAREAGRGRSFLNTESSGPSPYVDRTSVRTQRAGAVASYAELSDSDGDFEPAEAAPQAVALGPPEVTALPPGSSAVAPADDGAIDLTSDSELDLVEGMLFTARARAEPLGAEPWRAAVSAAATVAVDALADSSLQVATVLQTAPPRGAMAMALTGGQMVVEVTPRDAPAVLLEGQPLSQSEVRDTVFTGRNLAALGQACVHRGCEGTPTHVGWAQFVCDACHRGWQSTVWGALSRMHPAPSPPTSPPGDGEGEGEEDALALLAEAAAAQAALPALAATEAPAPVAPTLGNASAAYLPAGLPRGLAPPAQRVGVTALGATSVPADTAVAVAFVPLPLQPVAAVGPVAPPPMVAVAQWPRHRRRPCGVCAGCRTPPCGTCENCLDASSGRRVHRRACIQRRCVMLLALAAIGGAEPARVARADVSEPASPPLLAAAAPPAGLYSWLIASVYGGDCGRSQCERACFCPLSRDEAARQLRWDEARRAERRAEARAREEQAADAGGETSAAPLGEAAAEIAPSAMALAAAESVAAELVQQSSAVAASGAGAWHWAAAPASVASLPPRARKRSRGSPGWLAAAVMGWPHPSPPPSPHGSVSEDGLLAIRAARLQRETTQVVQARSRWEDLQASLASAAAPLRLLEARAGTLAGNATPTPGLATVRIHRHVADETAATALSLSALRARRALHDTALGTAPSLPEMHDDAAVARSLLEARSGASRRANGTVLQDSTRSARSWLAAGHRDALVLPPADGTGDRALARRRERLTVLPGDPEQRSEMVATTQAYLQRGYADSTNSKDEGHWKAWELVCDELDTSPWRTDVRANLGHDPEGHQEEVFLLATAMVRMYGAMHPRRNSDPAADPRSAKKKIEGVRRRHLTRGITMAPMTLVTLAVKGMCREYIALYGVDTLVPERKLAFSDSIMRAMLRAPDGSRRGNLVLDRNQYYWLALLACFSTLAEEGSRKDEVAKATEATPFRKGRLTFASLVWKYRGREYRHLSRAQLRTLGPGDGVLLRHGVAKNDAFGSHFAATPSFMAWRSGGERCACRALAEMELASGVAPQMRAETPLFGPRPGEEFTHSQVEHALDLLLVCGAGVPETDLANYSVHSFRIYVACALLAAKAPRWLIKRMLRWRGDESLEIYARVNDDEWAEWIGKTIDVAVHSSMASRFSDMDFSPEVRKRFTEIASAMLAVNATAARAATH